jgi:hypothetical protein
MLWHNQSNCAANNINNLASLGQAILVVAMVQASQQLSAAAHLSAVLAVKFL